MQQMTIIIKPYHACNAECVYCSAYTEGVNKGVMKIEVIRRLFEELRRMYLETGFPRQVLLIWHGGEPLAVKDSFYYEMLELQHQLLDDTEMIIEHTMQTNLLLLNEAKMAMIKAILGTNKTGRNEIGSSIDPIPGVRVVKKWDYNTRWFEKVELIQSHGVNLGAICVVHKHHLADIPQTFNFFHRLAVDLGISARFNPLYKSGRAKFLGDEIHLTPKDWGAFMVEFYRLWVAHGKKGSFAPFIEFDNLHLNDNFSLACENAGSCVDSHLGVDTDGSVYLCGRTIDDENLPFGSIMNQSLSEILANRNRVAIKNRLVFLKNSECKGCKWWEYCHGGCPSEVLGNTGTLAGKSGWCEGRYHFFEEVYANPREQAPHSYASVRFEIPEAKALVHSPTETGEQKLF